MASQLIRQAELEPGRHRRLAVPERIAVWLELMEAGQRLLHAGLRRKCQSNRDVHQAYRRCYARWTEEHDRAIRNMLERSTSAGADQKHG